MRRILIVPHRLFESLSASFLDRRSLSVRSAGSAAEAIKLTAAWLPELIVFSSELPDVTSVDLCLRVRADQRLASVKLLLVSSFLPGDEVAADVLLARADAHLMEPIGTTELLHTIGALLDVQQRRALRLPQEFLAHVGIDARVERPPRSMLANIIGMSGTGLELECAEKLATGDLVTVTFALPDTDIQVSTRCMVLSADALQLHYGCEFIECHPDDQRAIRDFVDREVSPDGPD
jgi:DNA-binding response OmpR family regulator